LAVLQEIGVYDLNHLGIDVFFKNAAEPVNVKVKDEMIVIL